MPGSAQASAPHPKRILLLPMLGLGDAVCYLPFLQILRAHYPAAELVVLVTTGAAGAILKDNLPGVEIVVFNRSEQRSRKDLVKLLLAIRKRKFDIVISGAHLNSARVPVFAFLTGSPIRVGANSERYSFLYNRRVDVRGDAHYFERYRKLLSGLGIDVSAEQYHPHLHAPADAEAAAAAVWKAAGIDETRPVVGMASGADLNTRGRWIPALKRWSAEGYAEVARWAVQQGGAQVVFFGSPAEGAIADEVASLSGVPIINLCGKTNLAQLQWLIRKCTVFVANDTGSMHMAAGLGANLVSLFGPTNPLAVLTTGHKRRVVQGFAPCSPCHFLPTCDLKGCIAMDDIAPAAVIAQVAEFVPVTVPQT